MPEKPQDTTESKPSSTLKITVEHQGDIGDYEMPTISLKAGGKFHPAICSCQCGSEGGSGGGNGRSKAQQ